MRERWTTVIRRVAAVSFIGCWTRAERSERETKKIERARERPREKESGVIQAFLSLWVVDNVR